MGALDPKTWPDGVIERYSSLATDGPKATARGTQWAVTAEHPLATLTGERVLDAGGSAADAFVAMAAVEHVVMPGTTSLGGVFGGVYYDAATKQTIAVNAGLNAPLDDGDLGAGEPYDHLTIKESGRACMVPGAVRGLESLHQRFGRLPWADLWEPAIYFARTGFQMWELFHKNLVRRADVVLRRDGGRANFAPGGQLPAADGVFAQPILADTLEAIALDGADYCYTGQWARDAVAAVRAAGGRWTMADLERYEVRWDAPLVGTAFGAELHTVVPPHYAGATALLGLAVLEELGLHEREPAQDARTLYEEIQAFKLGLMTPAFVQDLRLAGDTARAGLHDALSREHAQAVAASIRAGSSTSGGTPGLHSHNLIAVDAEGSMVTGTYTIHSDSWGDPGIIVGGISINSAAHALLSYRPPAGERIAEPLSAYIAFRDGEPVLASTVIGSGLVGCQLQNSLNVLGRGMSAEDSIGRPRYGFFEFDVAAMTMTERVQVEPLPGDLLDGVEALGQPLARKSYRWEGHAYADTGYWAAIERDPSTGELAAVTDPRLTGLAVAR